MDRGWVKSWRKTLDSAVFLSTMPDLIKVWEWCKLRASSRRRWVSISIGRGRTEVELQAGQFVYGRHSAAMQIPGCTARMIQSRMEKLSRLSCITLKPCRHYTLVTICNWGTYQGDESSPVQAYVQPSDHRPTTVRPPSVTNKKEEKGKKEENGKNKDLPDGKSSCRTKLRFDDADLELANWMFERIRILQPSRQTPNFGQWANTIRLMREQDGRTRAEIKQLFDLANKDDFWAPNILSPGTLRKQWTKGLDLKLQKGRHGQPSGPGQRYDPERPCEPI